MLKLALAWGQPIEYIENLPYETLIEFKALNTLEPFTHDAKSYREGLIATILYNSNVSKKKDLKQVSDLFPYLAPGTPDWLEDEDVIHARNLISSIKTMNTGEMYHKQLVYITDAIRETIRDEMIKQLPDRYKIDELNKILKQVEVDGKEDT